MELKWTHQENTKNKWTVDGKYGNKFLTLTLTKLLPVGVRFRLDYTQELQDGSWDWDTIHEEEMLDWTIDPFTKQEALKKAKGILLSPMEYLASELNTLTDQR